MHSNCICHQCKQGTREAALAVTRLDVAQKITVNIGVPSGDKEKASFIYSIGLLEHFNHPEIIITGLRLDLAHFFLNTFREFIKEGDVLIPEKIYFQFSQNNLPLIFKYVHETLYDEYLGYGLDYYKTFEPQLFEKFSALQMIWCDTKSRFPWDSGYEFSQTTQPLLYEGDWRRAGI